MSVYLCATSFITTVLIPANQFADGGQAIGRALAYLAHERLGEGFGTVYDLSSILILWFAGAAAVGDPSEFATPVLAVHGEVMHGRYRLLTFESSTGPMPWRPFC